MKGEFYIDIFFYVFVCVFFEILFDVQCKYNDYLFYMGNWKGNCYFVNYCEVDGCWYFSEVFWEGIWCDGGIYINELIVMEVKFGCGKVIFYME